MVGDKLCSEATKRNLTEDGQDQNKCCVKWAHFLFVFLNLLSFMGRLRIDHCIYVDEKFGRFLSIHHGGNLGGL